MMSDRVYCTADGEWPEVGQTVIYVEYGQAHLGKLLFKDTDDGHEWQNETGTQWFLKKTPIYWQPVITSLKDEYERQHESENA